MGHFNIDFTGPWDDSLFLNWSKELEDRFFIRQPRGYPSGLSYFYNLTGKIIIGMP